MLIKDILNEVDSQWDAPAPESHSLHMQLIEKSSDQLQSVEATYPLLQLLHTVDVQ